MSKTKAELQAENARLREVNEALLGLLAVIGQAYPPVPADGADMDKFYCLATDWCMFSAHSAEALLPYAGRAWFADIVRDGAKRLGKQIAGPLPYAAPAPEPEPVLEGAVTGKTEPCRQPKAHGFSGTGKPVSCDVPAHHAAETTGSRM